MRVYREIENAEQIGRYQEVRSALSLANQGDLDRACAQIEEFVRSNPDEGARIFALREAIAWKAHQGLLDEAVYDASQCVQWARSLWGEGDERTLVMVNTELYRVAKAGLGKKAAELAQKATELAAKHLEETDSLALAIRNNAAHAYVVARDDDLAGQCYQMLLDDFDRWGLSDSEEAVTTRDNYATVLMNRELYQEALEIYLRQLAVVSGIWGQRSEATLEARFEVGLATYCAEDSDAAEAIWRELADDCERELPKGHELSVRVLTVVIQCALESNDYAGVAQSASVLISHLDEVGDGVGAGLMRKLRNQCLEKEW